MSKDGSKGAQKALKLTEDSERLIGSVLLGNNLVNILATSLATAMFTVLFGNNGIALATLVMTLLVLIFAEVLPKTYAITNPEKAASMVARIVAPIVWVLSPIVTTIRAFVRFLLRLVGVKIDPGTSILAAHEEIKGAISLHHSEGMVKKDDRDEIMLHRSDIEMIDIDLPAEEILSQCFQSTHTRIPIFREEPENVIGVLHTKDLLRAVDQLIHNKDSLENFEILSIARDAYFVPETTSLDDQMREFLRRKVHFALVVDEYGSLQGLITLEDILEEIVGEIADEHDLDENDIRRETDGSIIVDGAMTIRDLNRECDWNLPDDNANTIAGLVIHEARMIPAEGQVFSFQGVRFEVLKREINRLTSLKLRKI